MYPAFLVSFVIAMVSGPAFALDISGMSLGDPISETRKLGSEPVAEQIDGPLIIQKYELPSGNTISLTAFRKSEKIVYIELNWGGTTSGQLTDIGAFRFGTTTLSEIRQTFGSNGYAHKERIAVPLTDGVAYFNSYGVAPEGSEALTFVSVTGVGGDPANAILDTIILSDAAFQGAYWGEDKVFDPAYSPVVLP